MLLLGNVRSFEDTDPLPVDSGKERMRLYLVHTVDPEPAMALAHKLLQQVLRRFGQLSFLRDHECVLPVQDLLAGGRRVLRKKRGVAHLHLEQDCSQGPPVNRLRVSILA